MPIEEYQSGILTGFSMMLPVEIPTSLQIKGGEYIVNNDSVTTLLHLHLEYYTLNW